MSEDLRSVLVVSASPVWRGGAAAALAPLSGIEVSTAQAPGGEADAYVLQAPGRRELLAWERELPADRPLIVVADADDAAPAFERAAALGRLSPAATPAALRAAVLAVLEGLSVSERAPAPGVAWRAAPIEHEPLTPRELEVFELMSKGLSNKEIGGVLGISTHTAKFHVSQILAKVGASTRAEAVSTGLRMGWVGL